MKIPSSWLGNSHAGAPAFGSLKIFYFKNFSAGCSILRCCTEGTVKSHLLEI